MSAVTLMLICIGALLTAQWVRRAPADPAVAALMERWQAPPEALGTNAFKHLWLIEWDIPGPERAAVLAEDRRRALAQAQAFLRAPAGSLPPPDYTSSAGSRFVRWSLDALPQLDCGREQDRCLDGLADIDAEAWRRLDSAPLLRERLAAVHGFGHLRVEEALHFATYVVVAPERTGASRVWLAMAARAFRSGSQAEGLGMACRELATSRRFAEGSAHLITRMGESSRILSAVHLTVEMLAEYPADALLPNECAVLSAPLPADSVSMCAVVGAEHRWLRHSLQLAMREGVSDVWPAEAGEFSHWLFDLDLSLQWRARAMSWACDPEVLAQMHRGEAAVIQRVRDWPSHRPALQCAANPVGCTLDRVSQPDLSLYVERIMDELAALRMVAVLAELRPHLARSAPIEDALDRLAPSDALAARSLRLHEGRLGWEGPSPKRSLGLWPLPASRLVREPDPGPLP